MGSQKCIEVDDFHKLTPFMDKHISNIVPADSLGEEWKGYLLKITGGNDKQGFPMMQGVLTNLRVRLLLSKGSKCYRERRNGERKRKSVRGCIVDNNLSVISMSVEQKGANEIPGLTDTEVPKRLGPKRASKIRKLFNLSSKDDVRKYVIRRELPEKDGKKKKSKAPKIQNLVTPITIQRKRRREALKNHRKSKKIADKEEYSKLLALRNREARDRKRSRSHSMRESTNA